MIQVKILTSNTPDKLEKEINFFLNHIPLYDGKSITLSYQNYINHYSCLISYNTLTFKEEKE